MAGVEGGAHVGTKLHEKAKKMADKYSWIVFKHRSIGVSNQKDDKKMMSFMLFKSKIL